MGPVPPFNPVRTLQPLIRSRAGYQRIQSRVFVRHTRLLHTSRLRLRPQLPLLHAIKPQTILQPRSARSFTTEDRQQLRENAIIVGKCCLVLVVVTVCFGMLKNGLQQWEWEKQYPEPPEFSWRSKWLYRTAKGKSAPGRDRIVEWMGVANAWKTLIEKLEDPQSDGAGIKPRLGEGEDLLVEGIGKTGFDITAKSETWRRGYFEALMGAAKAGEHLDGWIRDKNRPYIAFPPESVIGPSNPRPKPVPHGWPDPPKEEDCEAAFDRPEVYYMKILTTESFTSRQKLEAALAYADFLQSGGLSSSASDMIEWGMDIATRNAHPGVVDKHTGIIADGAAGVSENIILATSALAMHKVRSKNLAAALPIYISILRAQRSLPLADPILFAKTKPLRKVPETWFEKIKDMFEKVPYPDPPTSGDEQATRTLVANCDEAATMAHIGEILYASSYESTPQTTGLVTGSQEAGLSWTRDAVELAEATFELVSQSGSRHSQPVASNASQTALQDSSEETKARDRCAECLAMAVENWKKMVEPLREAEKVKRQLDAAKPQQQTWTWLWNSTPTKETSIEPGKWEREEMAVETRQKELQRLLLREGLYFADS